MNISESLDALSVFISFNSPFHHVLGVLSTVMCGLLAYVVQRCLTLLDTASKRLSMSFSHVSDRFSYTPVELVSRKSSILTQLSGCFINAVLCTLSQMTPVYPHRVRYPLSSHSTHSPNLAQHLHRSNRTPR